MVSGNLAFRQRMLFRHHAQGAVQPDEVDPMAMGDELTLLVGSVTEVAVKVTVPPEGATAGEV